MLAERAATLARMAEAPPFRYLSAADVVRAMPPLDERLRLAERTMTALVGAAEMPPKIGVHPRPAGSFVHAMPAHLRGGPDGSGDLVGMKWVAGFGTNNEIGLPAVSAVIVMNDAATGLPIAILDGGPVTAERTAAVSGVAIRHFGPRAGAGDGQAGGSGSVGPEHRAALIGAGVQGRSHLAVLGHLLPGVGLTVHDRHPERAAELAELARVTEGIGSVRVVGTARDAVDGADVVVTAASFGPVDQVMTGDWLTADALVVPVDYATYCSAEVARDAALFLVDERGQFLANREAGLFEGYPDPSATLGEAILAGTRRPPEGRVVVTHLGVGLADVIFADAILRRAEAEALGTLLQR
jgi:ornithine cyclodeaminase/alanine dehydrogenase-like protein (mu-crystallin family)